MQNFEREVVVYDFPLLTSIGEMFLRRPIFVLAIRKSISIRLDASCLSLDE